MRQDQAAALDDLSESLMDVFLTEADPGNWTGAGTPANQMTPEVRGARNWDAKNANQVGALMMRALELRDRLKGLAPSGQQPDDRADSDIAKFEKQARTLLDRVAAKHGG